MSEFQVRMQAALLKRVQASTPEQKAEAMREMEALIKGTIKPMPEPFDPKRAQCGKDED